MNNNARAPLVCLYFQGHQPTRLKEFDFFQLGTKGNYENESLNKEVLEKVDKRCYQPANALFKKLLDTHGEKFAVSYSLSGILLDQLNSWAPDTLKSFQELATFENVEYLAETYYHSVAYLSNDDDDNIEFFDQVEMHKKKINELFGVTPVTFRNTELIFSNHVSMLAERMGYKNIIFEGLEEQKAQSKLTLRSPHTTQNITAIPRSLSFSDDVAFRFSDQSWGEFPLTAEKFVDWILNSEEDFVNIFIDYETLGEHQWEDSGIFEFWESWINLAIEKGVKFVTPNQLAETITERDPIDCHEMTSWADEAKDLTAWRENVMQKEAIDKVFRIRSLVSGKKDLHDWRKLGTSDHFYYMSTKTGSDGEVHEYFSPYKSPYDAYLYYMNILADHQIYLKEKG